MYGDDVKHSQLRKGDHHGCRIDETIQLEVSGDTPEGMSVSVSCLWTFACKSSQSLVTHQKVCQALYLACGHVHAIKSAIKLQQTYIVVQAIMEMTSSLRSMTRSGGKRT